MEAPGDLYLECVVVCSQVVILLTDGVESWIRTEEVVWECRALGAVCAGYGGAILVIDQELRIVGDLVDGLGFAGVFGERTDVGHVEHGAKRQFLLDAEAGIFGIYWLAMQR